MRRIGSWVVWMSAAGLLLAVAGAPVRADWENGKKAERGEKHEYREKHQYNEDKHKSKTKAKREHGQFHDDDRIVVRDFYARHPAALPPGLAKRGGNLPPGLAKRGGDLPPVLARGQALTPEIEVHLLPLPRELEIRLPPPPHEVLRRIIGRDLVLIDKHNRKVLDVMKDALP